MARIAEGSAHPGTLYVDYVRKDLKKIIEYVVPEGLEGHPNLMSTKQVSLTCLYSDCMRN